MTIPYDSTNEPNIKYKEAANSSPQEIREELTRDALFRLEWPRIAETLAGFALFNDTAERFLNLTPRIAAPEREWIFKTTAEAIALIEAGNAPELSPVDTKSFLDLARLQSVLSAKMLYQVLALTRVTDSAYNFVKSQKSRNQQTPYPRLLALLIELRALPALTASLAKSINAEGEILSTASSELRSLRSRVEFLKRKVVDTLEDLIRKPNIKDALQDSVWMLRDGRYVLPVRADRRSDVSGVARGVSQSGSTIFLEPHALAATHSELEKVDVEMQLEEARILRELSGMVHIDWEALATNADLLSRLDDIFARAKFAAAIEGTEPKFSDSFSDTPRFHFEHARHPLFILEKKLCVPNDLCLEKTKTGEPPPTVWVLTGPNAGGKTVAMRTVGLNVLLAKAGLYVCATEARLCDFDDVFVELGDRQSREDDLSTFSGHLLQLKKMLDLASDRSLLLLDEGFVGTDPAIGMALARSTLEYLADLSATVIITTHFSNLKSLADSDMRFQNGSMEFEPQKLKPTYTLLNGFPGQSYALELGERLRFQEKILQSARVYHGEEGQRMERLLNEIQQKRVDIQAEFERSFSLRKKMEEELTELKSDRAQMALLRENLVTQYRNKLQKRLNAFENRLDVRERQYQRGLASLAQEPSSQAPDTDSDGAQSTTILPAAVPGELKKSFEKTYPALQKADANQSLADKTRKPKSLSGFSALEKFSFPAKHKVAPEFEAEDELDAKAKSFRNPKKLTPRELVDEAKMSLSGLQKGFTRIEDTLKKDFKSLGELENEAAKKSLKNVEVSQSSTTRPPEFWKSKMRVKTSRFKEIGEVVKTADSKGLVECQFGLMKTKIPYHELLTIEDAARGKSSQKIDESSFGTAEFRAKMMAPVKGSLSSQKTKRTPNAVNFDIESTFQHAGNTFDLRGLLVEEATDKLSQFLDRAWRENLTRFIIIHGHGTGRVKQAVRDELISSSYELTFRPGGHGEGGDGATVVQMTM